MIRRPSDRNWILIMQPQHAAVCGLLAEAWGNDEFSVPEPHASVLLAGREHENGWEEWEASPGLSAAGDPASFGEVGIGEHLGIWRRGIARVLDKDPYAGLLVSLHASGHYRGGLEEAHDTADGRRLAGQFLSEQDDLQRNLRKELRGNPDLAEAVTETTLMHNSRLLHLWDWLSLLLCGGKPQAQVIGSTAGRYPGDRVDLDVFPRDARTLRLKPYPLRKSPITFTISGRTVPRQPFQDQEAFVRTLQDAPFETLTFRVERGSAWSGRGSSA